MGWFRFHSYPITNIYHCTVHKAGSQWLASLLSDEMILNKTGLKRFVYQELLPGGFDPRKITDRFFYLPFPEKRIITPLYLSYECYKSIIKPPAYKSIYIYRDPRDILVSYYHSVKQSHKLMGDIDSIREKLQQMDQEAGLIFCIQKLSEQDFWMGMKSWKQANDPRLLQVPYEHLIGEKYNQEFEGILDHLEISLSKRQQLLLVEKYKFEKLSGGRKAGVESEGKHVRKGVAGDWINYFTPEVAKTFNNEAGEIHDFFGYK